MDSWTSLQRDGPVLSCDRVCLCVFFVEWAGNSVRHKQRISQTNVDGVSDFKLWIDTSRNVFWDVATDVIGFSSIFYGLCHRDLLYCSCVQ